METIGFRRGQIPTGGATMALWRTGCSSCAWGEINGGRETGDIGGKTAHAQRGRYTIRTPPGSWSCCCTRSSTKAGGQGYQPTCLGWCVQCQPTGRRQKTSLEPLQAIRYCTDFAESDYTGLAVQYYWLIRRQIKNSIVLVRVLVREQGMPLSLDI